MTLMVLGTSESAVLGQDIQSAILGETGAKTGEVSTAELRRLLESGGAVLLDARPAAEFALSHIPGARNVAAKPGGAPSVYVSDAAEVERLVAGKKDTPLVLYCNGIHCGKSKRLADDLLAAGFTSVRRYQLGIPVWRALGGVCVIEAEALRRVVEDDRTAVFLDAREPREFAAATAAGARSLPASRLGPAKDTGEVKAAKDDGRLPMEDHNTRIVVFGTDGAQARAVAEAVAREAFHNVNYFAGTFGELSTALRR
jgi:rhodanese-related sulfurtransferase